MIHYQQEFENRLEEITEIFDYDEDTGEVHLIDLHIQTMDKIRDLNSYPVPMAKSEEMIFLQSFRNKIDEIKEQLSLEYEVDEDDDYEDEGDEDEEFYDGDKFGEGDDYEMEWASSNEEIDPFEGKIWDYITKSAKKKFDYQTFADTFKDFNDPVIPENLLWEVIQRIAAGMTDMEIKAYYFSQFILLGFKMPEEFWTEFITARRNDLGLEVLATKIATDSLNNGTSAIAVLGQVNKLLG